MSTTQPDNDILSNDSLNEVFAAWRGSSSLLLSYEATHRKLILFLDDRRNGSSLEVICLGCHHISGPFCWDNCNLEALASSMESHPGRLLKDEGATFKLECREILLLSKERRESLDTLND